MSKLKQIVFNKKILIVSITTAILVVLLVMTNSTALAFIGGDSNSTESINTGENYQFGYEEEGEVLPEGTTDIRGAATTDGRFIVDVTASSQDNQCSVNIPTGTIGLTEDLQPITQLSVVPMTTIPTPPEGNDIIGVAYDLGPSGATFDPPITVTFTYDPDQVTGDPSNLKIAIYIKDKITGEYHWKTLTNIHVDPDTHTISGDTDEFTIFAIVAPTPVETTLAETTTPVQTTTPAAPAATPTNWNLIVGIVAAVVIIAVVILYFSLRRRTA